MLSQTDPSKLVAARKGAPLLLGLGEGENFCASDASALLQVTRRIVYLEEGDVVELRHRRLSHPGRRRRRRSSGRCTRASCRPTQSSWGLYRHYMQKEIFEQPGAVAATLEMVTGASALVPQLFGVDAEEVLRTSRTPSPCSPAAPAITPGMVARYWLEAIAGIPCSVEIASEYRYRQSVPNPNALIITISQSGETADTIAALQHAKSLGQERTLAICNVAGERAGAQHAAALPHPRRAGDRGCVHQGVHHPAGLRSIC